MPIRRVIMESPTKSCTLDPIPTFLLKELIDALLPFLTVMISASLREGFFADEAETCNCFIAIEKTVTWPGRTEDLSTRVKSDIWFENR